jgi:hypothetical protein
MNNEYIQSLEDKKRELFEQMGKFPEREQELAQEYFSIDQVIIRYYKNQNLVKSQ